MNAPMRKVWTQAEFFAWAPTQDERYEFDGVAPKLMTGRTNNHSLITLNIRTALRSRLRGGHAGFLAQMPVSQRSATLSD